VAQPKWYEQEAFEPTLTTFAYGDVRSPVGFIEKSRLPFLAIVQNTTSNQLADYQFDLLVWLMGSSVLAPELVCSPNLYRLQMWGMSAKGFLAAGTALENNVNLASV
jgi:hypothetical protein